MCNTIKCAGQNTVDLINSNVSMDVQTGCTGYLHISAIRIIRIVNILQFIKWSHVDVMSLC